MEQRTHCPQGHPYSGNNLILKPNGWRKCRQCALDYASRKWRKDHPNPDPPGRKKQAIVTTRRLAYAPNHPLASKNGRLPNARKILYDKIGPGPHNCHWCNKEINWEVQKNGTTKSGITADHVDRNFLNDDPQNIVAACQQCNGTRFKIIRDNELFIVRQGHRHRAEKRTCKSCGKEFLFEIAKTKFDKGNTCSISCAGLQGAIAKWNLT